MRWPAHVLLVSLALLAGGADECGGAFPSKIQGEPCTRTSDCEPGLVCAASGVCDVASDASVPDGSPDAG